MMNVGTPDQAFAFSRLPNDGIGLARLEFIINRQIGIHLRALLEFDTLPEPLKTEVAEAVAAYPSPRDYFSCDVTGAPHAGPSSVGLQSWKRAPRLCHRCMTRYCYPAASRPAPRRRTVPPTSTVPPNAGRHGLTGPSASPIHCVGSPGTLAPTFRASGRFGSGPRQHVLLAASGRP
jgi:hypothetical protein